MITPIKFGPEFQVNTTGTGATHSLSVTLLSDGRFVVGWEDHGSVIGSPIGPHIRAQIFDPREDRVNLTGTALADDFIGTKFGDRMTGLRGDDLFQGLAGNDTLLGGLGRDALKGGNGKGADVQRGGLGKDILTGGDGVDRFVFLTPSDTGTSFAKRDLIRDFDQTEIDRIVLAQIDAGSAAGDQAFTYIGTATFSGTEGELRYEQSAANTIVQADIDGDGTEDFAITVSGLHTLSVGDFVL